MLLKLLKLNANEAIRSGAVATRRSGSVILRNTCLDVAPSTRAASVSSAGIACSAPVQTRKKYGKPSQRLTRMQETFAQVGSNSHGTWITSRLLVTPKSVLRSLVHTSTERYAGM